MLKLELNLFCCIGMKVAKIIHTEAVVPRFQGWAVLEWAVFSELSENLSVLNR